MRRVFYKKDEDGKPVSRDTSSLVEMCKQGLKTILLVVSLAFLFVIFGSYLTGQDVYESSNSSPAAVSFAFGQPSNDIASSSSDFEKSASGFMSSLNDVFDRLQTGPAGPSLEILPSSPSSPSSGGAGGSAQTPQLAQLDPLPQTPRIEEISFDNSQFASKTETYVQNDDSSEYSVAFYKTHKSGSTAVFAMMLRYAYEHNYTLFDAQCIGHTEPVFEFPHLLDWVKRAQQAWASVPNAQNAKADFMIEHTTRIGIFPPNKLMDWFSVMSTILRGPVRFVTILREPVAHLLSYYNFYIESDLPVYRAEGENFTPFDRALTFHLSLLGRYLNVTDVVKDKNYPLQFSVKPGIAQKLRNMMSREFGIYDSEGLRRHIYTLGLFDKFDLIMIAEEWDKSLLLMRHVLKWNVKDTQFDYLLQLDFEVKKYFGLNQDFLLPRMNAQAAHSYDFILDSLVAMEWKDLNEAEFAKHSKYVEYLWKVVELLKNRRVFVPHALGLMDILVSDLTKLDQTLYNYANNKLSEKWFNYFCKAVATSSEDDVQECHNMRIKLVSKRNRLRNYCKNEDPESPAAMEFRKCEWYSVDDHLWKQKEKTKWKPNINVPYEPHM